MLKRNQSAASNLSACSTKSPKKVFLGLSGGVDSSVSALLLKQQGYRVTGVYMKNWSRDLPGMKCPWARDLADAKRVAVKLGLDFKMFDFEKEYKQKVVDYMLEEYQKGNTPNPDIMCNQEIKFKLFADLAFEQGADYIATGHYARTNGANLLRAKDENKDQTYFLYRIPEETLARTLFPIGHLEKPEVKKLAAENNLHTATKKESMGVCFVGEAGIREFLTQYIEPCPGEVREQETDKILGHHDGAIFYTLGQRHGLNLGLGLPYYIVAKDMPKNIIYVSRNLNAASLWTDKLELKDVIIREATTKSVGVKVGNPKHPDDEPTFAPQDPTLLVRLRHRAELLPATLKSTTLHFEAPIKRPAPGQSAVLYSDQTCLGGGIVM